MSFRPDEEEARIIDRTRRDLGLKTRADALRHLVRAGAKKIPRSRQPVFEFRVKGDRRRSLSSEEIDRALYGHEGPS